MLRWVVLFLTLARGAPLMRTPVVVQAARPPALTLDADASVDLDAAIADDDFVIVGGGGGGGAYARRADDGGAAVDEAVVAGALAERARLRTLQEFGAADALAEELRAAFRIRVDDAAREWWCERPAPKRATHAFDGDADALDAGFRADVETILARRAAAQRARDFVVADALRDELRVVCGVEVNDRFRVWRLADSSYSRQNLPPGRTRSRRAK
jgi:hypothetical protein